MATRTKNRKQQAKAGNAKHRETAPPTTHFTVAGMNTRVPTEFYARIENQLGGVLIALDIIVAHPTEYLFDPEDWHGMSDAERSMAKLCVFHILQQHSDTMRYPFMHPAITALFAPYEY